MSYQTPRCIATPTRDTRCRNAATPHGGLYTCAEHAQFVTHALLDLWLSASTRRMLAFAPWETMSEGQALIDRMDGRAA